MQEAGGTTEEQVSGVSPDCFSVRRPSCHTLHVPALLPFAVCLGFSNGLQRVDRIHQATTICMSGNHILGLDCHELSVVAPGPGRTKTRGLGHQCS